MFLFNDGLSLMVSRLSLISNKYFLFSWAKTLQACQLNLFREEIRQKKSTLRILLKEFSALKVSLQDELNSIDFAHVITLFFGNKDEVQFNRKSSINFYRKGRLKMIPKKLFLTFPSMYFLILKRSSLRKFWTFVFHLSNLSMPTICSSLNCFIEISLI